MAMATLERNGWSEHGLFPSFRSLPAAWWARRKRAADTRALARAGRLGPRLLADMGIEDRTARSLVGDWEDLRPNGWLVRPRD